MKNKYRYGLIGVGMVFLIICAVIFALNPYRVNKQSFSKTQNQLRNLTDDLSKEKIVTSVAANNYCARNHRKYSAGDLGCQVGYSFLSATDESVLSTILNKIKKLGWQYKWDNTDSVNQFGSTQYIKHEVYGNGELTCQIGVSKEVNAYRYSISCDGLAKRAWYPMKEN